VRTRVTAAALGALLMLTLAGCTTPEPTDPTPTPTSAFASEEEAFAAAEATYRAYVDALNDVDLSDPETFEAVYALTTGEANAGERRSLSTMHADAWSVSGDTLVRSVEPGPVSADPDAVVLAVCSDVSGVEVSDANGASVVAADRPSLQATTVTLVLGSKSSHAMSISAIEGGDHECGE
jgi:hypothetical protein